MKAWVLHHINDIRLENVNIPQPVRGEVLVSVKAAGICGSDIPRIYRTGAHIHPLIPGHEFSGIVEQTGPDVSETWIGQRVGVFPLIPCGVCGPCRNRLYELCRNYDYTGSRRNGGFAEYVTVPEKNLLRLPESVSFQEAAMLEPAAVAVHAMRRVMISGSDTAVICGLGTIGLLLLMFLLQAGKARNDHGPARILAIGNKHSQKQMAMEMGLAGFCYCDSQREDAAGWIMEQTAGRGADVFFECVGKNETVTLAVDHMAPGGRVVLVGNPYSDMHLEKDIYWKVLRNQLVVTGTWNSSFTQDAGDDWHYALERIARKEAIPARLISHRFALEELEKGFRIMRDKNENYVKIMAVME